MTCAHRSPFPTCTRITLIGVACLIFIASGPARAADEDEELLIGPAAPSTQPVTRPSTQPAIVVPEDARAVLDSVRDAYRDLKSLRLAGTMRAELDVGGQKLNESATFEAAFSAPNRFRHAVRDGGSVAEIADRIVGGAGDKLYAYDPIYNRYQTAPSPEGRLEPARLPKPFLTQLEAEDPALLLALAGDASVELLRDLTAIEKIDDVAVDGDDYTALRMTDKYGGVATALFDSQTNLLRRIELDAAKVLSKKDRPEVRKARFIIDYSTVAADAELDDKQFAWTAPEDARDLGANPLVATAAAGDADDGDSPAAALEGKAAPDFTLKDAQGNEVSLADLKGQVVLLDFWATWCGPCRASLPHLDKIYQDKKEAGLKAFAVNLKEDGDKVQKFVEQTKLGLPVLFDPQGKVAEQFGVTGIPQTVVIGKDGTVKKVVIGSGTHELVRKAIEEAMK